MSFLNDNYSSILTESVRRLIAGWEQSISDTALTINEDLPKKKISRTQIYTLVQLHIPLISSTGTTDCMFCIQSCTLLDHYKSDLRYCLSFKKTFYNNMKTDIGNDRPKQHYWYINENYVEPILLYDV